VLKKGKALQDFTPNTTPFIQGIVNPPLPTAAAVEITTTQAVVEDAMLGIQP
jgi:hypothetical protein